MGSGLQPKGHDSRSEEKSLDVVIATDPTQNGKGQTSAPMSAMTVLGSRQADPQMSDARLRELKAEVEDTQEEVKQSRKTAAKAKAGAKPKGSKKGKGKGKKAKVASDDDGSNTLDSEEAGSCDVSYLMTFSRT